MWILSFKRGVDWAMVSVSSIFLGTLLLSCSVSHCKCMKIAHSDIESQMDCYMLSLYTGCFIATNPVQEKLKLPTWNVDWWRGLSYCIWRNIKSETFSRELVTKMFEIYYIVCSRLDCITCSIAEIPLIWRMLKFNFWAIATITRIHCCTLLYTYIGK